MMEPRIFILWTLYVLAATLPGPEPGVKGGGGRHKGRKMSVGMPQGRRTIIGGKKASIKEYPYMAYIRVFFQGDPFPENCGGTIIGERHILSAAHCFKKPYISHICIMIGQENWKHSKSLRYSVLHSTFYPKKEREGVDADIAVLMVDRAIPLGSRSVNSLNMSKQFDVLESGTKCWVAGWGKSETKQINPAILRHVSVPLTTWQQCLTAYPKLAKDVMCAGDWVRGGRDACTGDSGGPLVCKGKLTGVVKWGDGCGQAFRPGVYTDVRYYSRWVEFAMAQDFSLEKTRPNSTSSRRHPQCG